VRMGGAIAWSIGGLLLGFLPACREGSPRRPESHQALRPGAPTGTSMSTPQSDNGNDTSIAAIPGDRVTFYPEGALDRVAQELSRDARTGRTIGGGPLVRYVLSRRMGDGSPEVHERWMDVTIVQVGRASLLSGGTLTGERASGAGEYRGGTIAGGGLRAITAGDLFIVPAGIPHQFLVAAGDSVRYLTIKVAHTGAVH
jgi:hypothetical protein